MKKVFTATACIWKSYGSILQAMGLQKKLGIMGYENTILKCEAAPNKELNRSPLKAHTLKRLVVNIHKMFIYSKLNRRYQNTNKFMQENLDIQTEIIYRCCPILRNPALREAFHCETQTEVVCAVFEDNMGAISDLAEEILGFYGLSDNQDNVKN